MTEFERRVLMGDDECREGWSRDVSRSFEKQIDTRDSMDETTNMLQERSSKQ